jgi:site-specific DNA-methyltransferase (adenine-specific)
MARVEHIAEGVTLYLGDCMELLSNLPSTAAVVSDPPYGISYKRGAGGRGGAHSSGNKFCNDVPIEGDDRPFDPTQWLRFPEVVLFGADHFSMSLPHGRWLAWNKLGDKEPWDDFSDVEFAWHNKRGASRIFSHLWKGLAQKGAGVRREHPTQKPVELMEWCIGFVAAPIILDPYMGSGTTGVAAINLGRKFIGVEKVEKYFDIACRRTLQATRQADLFIEKPKPAKQEALL